MGAVLSYGLYTAFSYAARYGVFTNDTDAEYRYR